jgi:hypothetical protein
MRIARRAHASTGRTAEPVSYKNFAYSTVLTAPSPATSGTSLVVQSGDGAKFPAVPFNVTIWPTAAQPLVATAEIAECTAVSGDTLTIIRAQEGTSARTVVVGDQIGYNITAALLDLPQTNTAPATDEYVMANYSSVVGDEYVMGAAVELIFQDPSEMVVV